MDTQIDTDVQEVMTEERDGTDTATQMVNGQPDPSIDIVTTEAEKPPEDSSRPTRVRKQRSFTMSDEVHTLLAAQAKRGGATIGMSAYLETLVLMAEELSLDQHVFDLLGSHAARTGLTRTEFLSMLVLRAEYVVTWDQQANDTIGVLAARRGLAARSSWRSSCSRLTNSCPGSHLSLRRSHGGSSGSARLRRAYPVVFPRRRC